MMTEEERQKLKRIMGQEFYKHDWGYFNERVGNGHVVVPGCSRCKVRLNTTSHFAEHLHEKVWAAVEREFCRPSGIPVALHRIPLSSL